MEDRSDFRPRFNGGGQMRTPPVKEGEEIDVKIEAIAEKGDGIAKREGFVIFVPGVNVGDEVRIRITKVLRRVAFSERIGAPSGPIGVGSKPVPKKAPEPVADTEDFGNEPAEDTQDFGEEDAPAEDGDNQPMDDLDEAPAPPK